jgi:hypothetical protein
VSASEKYGIAIALLAMALAVVQGMTGTIPPLLGWPVVAGCVIAAVALIIHGRQERNVEQKQGLNSQEAISIKPQEGSLDTVTMQDRLFIDSLAIHMIIPHGHMDKLGLLADRAKGIPLNELIAMPCSECGQPRDKSGE